MDFSDEDYEPNATPKLSLTKFPNKHRLPLAALTPPLHAPAAVPFLWEEAPGKPRTRTTSVCETSPPAMSKAVCRSLDLPPRLLNEKGKITSAGGTTSPTAVLDWSDVSRSSFSSFRSLEEGLGRLRKRESRERSSSRSPPSPSCEGFKENRKSQKGNFDFSFSVSVSDAHSYAAKKIAKVKRRSSFMNFSRSNSGLLASICESFKQAVPWRWRQDKMRRVG